MDSADPTNKADGGINQQQDRKGRRTRANEVQAASASAQIPTSGGASSSASPPDASASTEAELHARDAAESAQPGDHLLRSITEAMEYVRGNPDGKFGNVSKMFSFNVKVRDTAPWMNAFMTFMLGIGIGALGQSVFDDIPESESELKQWMAWTSQNSVRAAIEYLDLRAMTAAIAAIQKGTVSDTWRKPLEDAQTEVQAKNARPFFVRGDDEKTIAPFTDIDTEIAAVEDVAKTLVEAKQAGIPLNQYAQYVEQSHATIQSLNDTLFNVKKQFLMNASENAQYRTSADAYKKVVNENGAETKKKIEELAAYLKKGAEDTSYEEKLRELRQKFNTPFVPQGGGQ